MNIFDSVTLSDFAFYSGSILAILLCIGVMCRLVRWSKRMSKGALLLLAIFPVLSVFPIPPQEIKKIEKMKQEQLKKQNENGEDQKGCSESEGP